MASSGGWLNTRILLRLQEGADRIGLRPVARVARQRQMELTDRDDWSMLWSWASPWELKSVKERAAGSPRGSYLINHMPGTIRLASKVHLVKFSADLAGKLPRTFGSITPET